MPFLAETQTCADEVSEVTIIQKSAREHFGALFRCVLIASSIDYERPISLSFQMSKRHTNMTTRQPRHSKSYRVFCDTVVVLVFGIHVE